MALALIAGRPTEADALAVQHDSYVAAELAGSSNGDGIVGPGDQFTLTEKVVSAETQALTGVSATLSSTDGGTVVNQGSSAYPNLQFGVATANTTPFSLTVPSGADCGTNLALSLQLNTAQGSQAVPFSVATGATGAYRSFTAAQVPLAIPDNQATGAVSTINVSQPGRVKRVRVQIGRITHPYDGDLRIELIAPDGTSVTLVNPNAANSGQNFVNTVFDQTAATSVAAASAPYTGSFRPVGDLSAFNGRQQQGAWKLKVTDTSPGGVGTLDAWGTTVAPAVCTNTPIPSIAASPNPVAPGGTVTFDGSGSVAPTPGAAITDYRWDLDGSGAYATDTGASPTASRAYSTRGAVTVGLRITDSTGKTGQTTLALSVSQAPVAAMSVSPANPIAASAVTFDASASTHDPAGTIVDYRWDLDGSGNYATDTGTTPRVSSTYATSRTVPVHVRVTDDTGASATAGQSVTVANAPPTASFAVPSPVLVGQPTTLDASSSRDPDGSVVNYRWDLGGSGSYSTDTGNSPRVTTTFAAPGLINVGLSVTDNEGASATSTRVVQVTRPPVARLSGTPNPAAAGGPVTLDAGASSSPDGILTSYRWDLDGSGTFATSTGATPALVHTFASPGIYPVGVRVTDNFGAMASSTVTITVTAAPTGPIASPAVPGPASAPPSVGGDLVAGIARLTKADLGLLIVGSDRYFAAITGAPVRRARTVARGLWLNVLADRPARFALTLSVSAADARRLHLKPSRRARSSLRRRSSGALVTLGAASISLAAAGQRPVRVSLGPAATRALRRLRGRVQLLVTGVASDGAGHRARVARAFSVRR